MKGTQRYKPASHESKRVWLLTMLGWLLLLFALLWPATTFAAPRSATASPPLTKSQQILDLANSYATSNPRVYPWLIIIGLIAGILALALLFFLVSIHFGRKRIERKRELESFQTDENKARQSLEGQEKLVVVLGHHYVDLLKQQQNRGYVIAGGAAIIALIAFFLPYITASYLGISASASGTSGGWLWFEEIAAIVSIAVAAVLIFRTNAFRLTNMPVEKQIRYGRITLLVAGILALLLHLLFLLSYQGEIDGSLGTIASGLSFGLGFGWFLFLIAAIGMVVGAVMAYRQPIVDYTASQQQYGQPYPTADQHQQYPPYQSVLQQSPPFYGGAVYYPPAPAQNGDPATGISPAPKQFNTGTPSPLNNTQPQQPSPAPTMQDDPAIQAALQRLWDRAGR